jgi:hypothetical protein
MSPQEALNVLQQAAAKFLGTLQDHQVLQTALQTLAGAIPSEAAPAPKIEE